MIVSAIQDAFQRAKEEKWWKLYVGVDIHGVVFPSTFDTSKQRLFAPSAKETLQHLSNRIDIELFLWTCSHPDEVAELTEFFNQHDIYFNYDITKPDVPNTAYGNYDTKPYYNILFDDKAGFERDEWPSILKEFKKNPVLPQSYKIVV